MMEIKKSVENGKMVIALEGRLDTTTAPNLEAELKASIEGIQDLLFYFEALEYISSAGLRVLLSAQKIMSRQGEMKIKNASEEIKEVFELTGFMDILTVI